MLSGAMEAAGASPGADLFHGIVMAEERFHGEGYREGYAEGSHVGAAEGRRCGALHGAAVGAEVGCYLGFAQTWHCLLHKCTGEKNSKKIRVLDSLIGMIRKFPYEDPTYDKLQEDLEKIRGKYKQNQFGKIITNILSIADEDKLGDKRRNIKRTHNWEMFFYSYSKQNKKSEQVLNTKEGREKH